MPMASPEPTSNCSEPVHRSDSVSLQAVQYVPFYRIVLCWLIGVTALGGPTIWLLEGGGIAFVDALYMAANAVTATGLSSVDLSLWRPASKAVLLLCIQAGSSTMISLMPVALRLRGLRRILPRERTYDLCRFRKVPQWLVEYKALVILLRVMIAYQVVVHALYTVVIFAVLSSSEDLSRRVLDGGHVGNLQWSIFHVVSAYNNAGFSLHGDSLVGFSEYPFLLFLVAMVCLHGNVMLPVYTRWIIVFLSATAPQESSRKVFFRYLLMNGRDLYSNIFVSQQTWLLFLSQLFLIVYQLAVFFLVPPPGDFSKKPASMQMGTAFFLAVNTRHAGLTSINMADVPSSTLVCYLLMMFMAPAPFIAVMRSSMNAAPDPRELIVRYDSGLQQPLWRADSGWLAESSVGPRRERTRSRTESSDTFDAPPLPDDVVEEQERQALAAAAELPELTQEPSTSRIGRRPLSRRVNLGMLMRRRELELERELLLRRIESGHWAEKDFRTDARVLLTVLYQDDRIPLRRRVGFRVKAIGFHLRQLCADMVAGTAVRDVALIWFSWFLLAALGAAPRDGEQFAVLFELVSAYGNVGLSLGSKVESNPNASFSGQFNDLGLFVMIAVELLGTMRSMPLTADSVFIMKMPPSPEDLLLPDAVPEDTEDVELSTSHVSRQQ